MSIIVPFYNVEGYISECLESVVGQTYKCLEIILVDDGGSDDSYRIAQRFAQTDQRIRIIRQSNAGLGAARNAGLRRAHGTYLRFVDSDDVLPLDSTATMVRTIRKTGSDFVVGDYRRLTFGTTRIIDWTPTVHRRDRFGINVEDLPDILRDVLAPNKLFNARFFRKSVKSYPEGIRYEDQEPAIRAYLSGRFDVLKAVVYHWRLREDGTSISQQKTNPADLRDWLTVQQRVSRLIAEGADKRIHQRWLAMSIGVNLLSYYRRVARTDYAFWTQLRDGVLQLASEFDTATWHLVPMAERLLALAALDDLRGDLIALMIRRYEYGTRPPGIVHNSSAFLDTTYLHDLSLRPDRERLRLADADVEVRSRLSQVRWKGNHLHLAGFAYLTGIDLASTLPHITLELLSRQKQTRLPFAVDRHNDPWIDVDSGDSYNSYQKSAFATTIDLTALSSGSEDELQDIWSLQIRVEVDGIARTASLCDVDSRGELADLPVGRADQKGRWILVPNAIDGLGLRFQAPAKTTLRDIVISGRHVTVVTGGLRPDFIEVRCAGIGRTLTVEPSTVDSDSATFLFQLPEIPADADYQSLSWSLRTVTAKRGQPLLWSDASNDLRKRFPAWLAVRPTCGPDGALQLRQSVWGVALTTLGLIGARRPELDGLAVQGYLAGRSDARYAVRLTRDAVVRSPEVVVQPSSSGGFEAQIPCCTETGTAIVSGKWVLEMIEARGEYQAVRRVPVDDGLLGRFPLLTMTERVGIRCTRTRDAAVRIEFDSPYDFEDRGRLGQRRIHTLFEPREQAHLESSVVLESFAGKNASDSVYAIYQELRRRQPGWRYYWSVANLFTSVPEGAEPLLRHTTHWAETVRTARYLIHNANFPYYFRKQKGQIYIQTWHGTPLKKIGRDVPAANLTLSYRALMEREAEYWDYLLAQNSFAASKLPAAFGYKGVVIATGYPRNDALIPNAAARAAARRQFELQPDDIVVLYAPTWRDNVRNAAGHYALVDHLNFDEALRRLDGVKFLVRGHPNTAASVPRNPAIVDASDHPNINDLIIASDVLVTDYSSVMFDYCVTGKPMMFLVPDLETYRDSTRGFYLSLEDIAPGPICRTTGGLITELSQLATYPARYREAYADFTRRFAPYDDGSATSRVVDAIWGTSGYVVA